jgi:very-short-patch-repair endonuclease
MTESRINKLLLARSLSVRGKRKIKSMIVPTSKKPIPTKTKLKIKDKEKPVIDDSAREATEIFSAKQRLLEERKSILKEGATSSEIRLAELLDEAFVRFMFQKGLISGAPMFYIVDFYIPSLKLCIEADGGYHNNSEARAYDAKRNDYLTKKRKFTVLRISNYEILTTSSEELMTWVSTLKKRRVNYSPNYYSCLTKSLSTFHQSSLPVSALPVLSE